MIKELRRSTITSLILASFFQMYAQQVIGGDSKIPKAYEEKDILDPDYGIKKYDKLNFWVGGDSVRNTNKGYACQGWYEDNYTNGKLLHRGYYVDGQLKIYRNYFDNGQLEREFKITDLKRAIMKIYYKDGKQKADIEYYGNSVLIEQDYYSNGHVKYAEEHTKNMENLVQMNSFAEDGKPQSLFELTDKKKKLYYKKEYYENGTIKEEGPMKYSTDVLDYRKEGTWKFYDETGNLKSTDNFVNGQGGNSN
jgi:antitoxin component YwqK of YwqJK toxin-antitoxin module